METRSSAARADYDLQAAIGATEIAHGDLAAQYKGLKIKP